MTERIDQIGFGGLELIQEPAEFCYGVDAVLLADFAAPQRRKYGCSSSYMTESAE